MLKLTKLALAALAFSGFIFGSLFFTALPVAAGAGGTSFTNLQMLPAAVAVDVNSGIITTARYSLSYDAPNGVVTSSQPGVYLLRLLAANLESTFPTNTTSNVSQTIRLEQPIVGKNTLAVQVVGVEPDDIVHALAATYEFNFTPPSSGGGGGGGAAPTPTPTPTSTPVSVTKNPAFSDKTTAYPTGVVNAVDVKVGSFVITNVASEDVDVSQINIGDDTTDNCIGTYVQNLTLRNDLGKQLAQTVANPSSFCTGLTNSYAFFLSPTAKIASGGQLAVDVYGDLKAAALTAPTSLFDVDAVVASGRVTGTNFDATFLDLSLQTVYIATFGDLMVEIDQFTPPPTNYLMGATDQTIAKFKFSANAVEDIIISQLVVSADFSRDATGTLQNLRLVDAESGAPIGSPLPSVYYSVNGKNAATATYAHAPFNNLALRVPKGGSKTIALQTDFTTFVGGGFYTTGQRVTPIILTTYSGDTADTPIKAVGAASGTQIEAKIVTTTPVGAAASTLTAYRAKLSAAVALDTPRGLFLPASETLIAKFTVTNLPNDGQYPAVIQNLNFDITTNVSTTQPRTLKVYRDSLNSGPVLAVTSWTSPGGTLPVAIRFSEANFTDVEISSGASKTFFVTADTQDAVGSLATSFNVTLPSGGVVWSDEVSERLTALPDLPLSVGTPVFPATHPSIPDLPTIESVSLVDVTSSTPILVKVNPGNNATSSATTFAIRVEVGQRGMTTLGCASGGCVERYLQGDGALGEAPAWLTYTQWGAAAGTIINDIATTSRFYQISVAAKFNANVSNFGSALQFVLHRTAQPTALAVEAITTSTIRFSWQSGGGWETEFAVQEFISNPEPTFRTLARIPVSSFITTYHYAINGLTPNTLYNSVSRVAAYDHYEASYEYFPSVYTAASLPSKLSATDISATQIILAWSGDATEYYAENITTLAKSGWTASTTFVNSGLNCGTLYSFRVKGKNGDGVETDFAPTISASTLPCPLPPGAPSGGQNFVSGGGSASVAPAAAAAPAPAPTPSAPAAPVPVSSVTTVPASPIPSGQVLGVKISRLDELATKLKIGARGAPVRELQNELKRLKLMPRGWQATSYYGPVTAQAVRAYRARPVKPAVAGIKIANNSLPKNKAEGALPSVSDLVNQTKFGQRGAAVFNLQTELRRLGFYPKIMRSTGYYGPATRQAVKIYLASLNKSSN